MPRDGLPRHANDLRELTIGLFQVWAGDYGMVHALTEEEVNEAREAGRPDLMIVNRKTGEAPCTLVCEATGPRFADDLLAQPHWSAIHVHSWN
jgi:hypothetical protein